MWRVFFLRAVLFITVLVDATVLSEATPLAGEKEMSVRAAVVTFRPTLGDVGAEPRRCDGMGIACTLQLPQNRGRVIFLGERVEESDGTRS